MPNETELRPFRVEVPEAELAELRRRISATRWPERETVTDDSQGVRLAMMQELTRYWGTDYDWRKCEGNLNALPNFVTEIDGLDIHFIHVRSPHEDALPLIVTHGWPGSIIEQLKIIEPLTNPTAHGASAADAFHLVIPSLPGAAGMPWCWAAGVSRTGTNAVPPVAHPRLPLPAEPAGAGRPAPSVAVNRARSEFACPTKLNSVRSGSRFRKRSLPSCGGA